MPALLNDAASVKVGEMAMTFEELLARDKPKIPLKKMAGKALLHGHCHQKAFDAVRPIEEVLSWIDGLEVTSIDSSCCGMAGAFGYGTDTYDISMQMANANLLPAVREAAQIILLLPTAHHADAKSRMGQTAPLAMWRLYSIVI